jgi:hypothetical protein
MRKRDATKSSGAWSAFLIAALSFAAASAPDLEPLTKRDKLTHLKANFEAGFSLYTLKG